MQVALLQGLPLLKPQRVLQLVCMTQGPHLCMLWITRSSPLCSEDACRQRLCHSFCWRAAILAPSRLLCISWLCDLVHLTALRSWRSASLVLSACNTIC